MSRGNTISIMRSFLGCLASLVLAAGLAGRLALAQPGLGIRSEQVSARPQIEALKPVGQVAGLIARLSDESTAQRQAAARALLEMGLAIEPQVRWALRQEEPP